MTAQILAFEPKTQAPPVPDEFSFTTDSEGGWHASGRQLKVSVMPGAGRRDGRLNFRKVSYTNQVTGKRCVRTVVVAELGGVKAEISPHVVECWRGNDFVTLRHGHVRHMRGRLTVYQKNGTTCIDAGDVKLYMHAGHVVLTRKEIPHDAGA